jgi:hypothetical protein
MKKPTPASVKILLLFLLVLNFQGILIAQNKDGELIIPKSFDSKYIYITQVEVNGNKKTKDRIIIRELDFNIVDSLASKDPESKYFNPLNNKFLYSWGFGLDLVSYNDLVLRFEYAFTVEGIHGFFHGLKAPI